MAITVGKMTKEELKEIISAIVEDKLTEIVGDPNEGLPIRESLRRRLLRQKRAVAQGKRGESFEDVVSRLGLV